MSGPTIMMQLGPIQFGLLTAAYEKLSHIAEYKWAAQERFGQNPALQFVGLGEEVISFDGTFYPTFAGNLDQVQTWRDLAAVGQPLTLVNGRGMILGDWVIVSIDDKQSIFADAGAALKNDFTMQIKYYDTPIYSDAITTAAANINPAPPDANAGASIASGATSTMGSIIGSITSSIAQISSVAHLAVASVGPALAAAQQAMTIARTVQNSSAALSKLLGSGLQITSISSAQNAFGHLMATGSNAANAGAGVSRMLGSITADFSSRGENPAVVSAIQSAGIGSNQLTMSSANINNQCSGYINSFTS